MSIAPRIKNMAHLIELIGAGVMNPKDPGPTPIVAELWTGDFITATYYNLKPNEKPDIRSHLDIILDDPAIQRHAERLMKDGTPFVTDTGSSDMVCTLRWEMVRKTLDKFRTKRAPHAIVAAAAHKPLVG